jgi:hypothetical protein
MFRNILKANENFTCVFHRRENKVIAFVSLQSQPYASSSRRGVTSLDGKQGSGPPKPRYERDIVPKAVWHRRGDSSVENYPFRGTGQHRIICMASTSVGIFFSTYETVCLIQTSYNAL